MRKDARTTTKVRPDLEQHPRGTLAIVLIFAALFTVGWFAFYLFGFMERGAPHH